MASRQEQGQSAGCREVQGYVYHLHPSPSQIPKRVLTIYTECSQAYEILSDPEKRKTYDQYGLEFILRGGVPHPEDAGGPGGNPFGGAGGGGGGAGGFPFASSGGMPGGTRSFHFSTGGGGGNGFNFSNADDIFGEFMRNAGGGGDEFDLGGFGMPGGNGGGKGGRFRGGRRAPEPEVTVVEKPLAVTLEELFSGTTKKLKIKRKTYDQSTGKQSTQDRILEVPIKKGLKPGSKIKFSDVGDQVEGGTQDLHFIISEVCAYSLPLSLYAEWGHY
jgi:DnaJ family protein B protein 4